MVPTLPPPNLAYQSMKINNSIKFNCLVIILPLFSLSQPSDRLVQTGKSLTSHARGPMIDPHPAFINLHFLLFCLFFFLGEGGGGGGF